jgi:hypothetical protein
MTKKPEKKKQPIALNEFDLDKFFIDEGFDATVKDKELSWIPLSSAFHEALGIPGIPKGYLTLLRGYTNTGKSTAAFECMAACQKIGVLPILIDTENNFSWEHAKNLGVQFEEVKDEYGEVINYKGFFRYINNDALIKKYGRYDYSESKEKKECRTEACVEDVSRFIDDMLTLQANGKLPLELCFIWDSIGSLDCFKSIKSNSRNNMWNAGALDASFKSTINHKIPSSKKEDKEFTNTFVGVQKIWLDSMQGAGTVKHKGGEAFFYAARLIIHFGGITSHGTSSLTAISNGNTYSFGIKTKIKCVKNQVNGIEWEGKIASTPTGFMNPDKQTQYLKEHKDFLLSKLGSTDIDIIEGEENTEIDMDF